MSRHQNSISFCSHISWEELSNGIRPNSFTIQTRSRQGRPHDAGGVGSHDSDGEGNVCGDGDERDDNDVVAVDIGLVTEIVLVRMMMLLVNIRYLSVYQRMAKLKYLANRRLQP